MRGIIKTIKDSLNIVREFDHAMRVVDGKIFVIKTPEVINKLQLDKSLFNALRDLKSLRAECNKLIGVESQKMIKSERKIKWVKKEIEKVDVQCGKLLIKIKG